MAPLTQCAPPSSVPPPISYSQGSFFPSFQRGRSSVPFRGVQENVIRQCLTPIISDYPNYRFFPLSIVVNYLFLVLRPSKFGVVRDSPQVEPYFFPLPRAWFGRLFPFAP